MNDKKILDRIVDSLEYGYIIDKDGDGHPFEYLGIKFEPFLHLSPKQEPDEKLWLKLTRGMAEWINAERTEEALNQKIKTEVHRQLKQHKK